MSGGGSAPAAPDLSKQTNNANQSFQQATSNAQQTMQTAQGYNSRAQNTLQNVVGAQTPMMSAINNSANQNLNQYGSTFIPLQQQQADFAKNYTSDQNIQNLQGRAVADQNSQLNAQLANQRQQLASEGVDPASIHGGALEAQARVQGAANAAQAANNAYTNAQLTGAGLVNQANQLGLNVGAQGTQQAATGANIGSQIVGNTNQTNATGVNNLTAANTYLNTGVNANKSAADIANSQFQDQMQSYQAQQAANASGLSALGSVAGAAMMFMEEGGVVPPAYGIPPNFMRDPPMGYMRASNSSYMQGGPVMYDHGGPVTERGALPAPVAPGTTDRKAAWLTPGEFVIPHDVAAWKGHEHWYKQMDKAREEMTQRTGIPSRMSSVHTARGV